MWNQSARSLLLLSFVLAPFSAHAAISFTEIMYDVPGTDTKREWVEIRNDGPETDLSGWKLFEAGVNHKLTAPAGMMIPAGGYAVIAENPDAFRADNPAFDGLLFDSAFSLSNSGETLILRDASGADSARVSYAATLDAKGNGDSLQIVGGAWRASTPTPGAENRIVEKALAQPVRETLEETVSGTVSETVPVPAQEAPREALAASAASSSSASWPWWVGIALIALMVGACAVLLLKGEPAAEGRLSAEDFDMIDISEK